MILMPLDCSEIVSTYIANLEANFSVEAHPSGCVIVTPFLRPDGDCIEILIEERIDGDLLLTDMGDTLGYLHVNGMLLSRRLMDDARRISHRFGASINVNEIVLQTEVSGINASLHDLVQASINIAALVEKRRPYANLRFEEEVEAVIIAQGRRYDLQYEVPGTREPHTVRFHIDSGLNMLVQPFSQASEAPARSLAERWNYRFNDILGANPSWTIFALLDDRGERETIWGNPYVTRPLEGVVTIVRWSQRGEFITAMEQGGGEVYEAYAEDGEGF